MILIFGDSWGVAEWHSNGTLSGPGIGNYFSLHSEVINLSCGAHGNCDQFKRFENLLTNKFQIDNDDTIYWIITDPLRTAQHDWKLIIESSTIQHAVVYILDGFFNQVNQICEQYNTRVNFIGGLCDLSDIDISSYRNLSMIVPSWCKLLDDNYCESLFCYSYLEKLGKIVHDKNPKMLDEWNDIVDVSLRKEQSLINLEKKGLFTGYHPSREAARILRDTLDPN